MNRNGILAAGNWILDTTKVIDTWPAQDALANILSETTANGGGPFNLLLDLAKLQAPFPLEAAGLIGTDPAGDLILDICRRHSIGTTGLHRTADAATSYTDVMTVRGTGRRTFFHQRGTNALFGPEHLDPAASPAKIFYLGYLLLLDRFDAPGTRLPTQAAETLEAATAAGLLTAIDVVSEDSDRFPAIVLPALPHTDYCILNEFEAGRTTGHTIRREDQTLDRDALLASARALLAAGVRRLVVVHFPEGAIALARDGGAPVEVPSLTLPPEFILGAAGAGDAFAAGVLYGLHEDRPVAESLHMGVCAAAACLSHPTTSGGLMPLNQCLALRGAY